MELRENSRRVSLFAAVRSDSIGESDDEAFTPLKDTAAPVRRFSVAASKVRRQISDGAGASERAIKRTTSTFITEAKKKEDQWIQEERSRPGAGPRGSVALERRRRGTVASSAEDSTADEPVEAARRRSCALEAEEQIILADIAKRKTIIDSEESLCDKRLSEIFVVEETQLCTLKKAAQSANVPVIQVASSVDTIDDARKDKKLLYDKLLAFKDEMLLLNLKRERTTKAVFGKKLDELTHENDELRATLDGLWQHCEAQGVSKCSPVSPPAPTRTKHSEAQKKKQTPPVRFLTDPEQGAAPLPPLGGGAMQSAVLKLRYSAEPCLAALRGELAALRADVAAFQAGAVKEVARVVWEQQQQQQQQQGSLSQSVRSRARAGGAGDVCGAAECGVQAAPEVCCGAAQTEEEDEGHVHPPSAEVLKAVEAGIRDAADASVRYVLREVPRRKRRGGPPAARRGRGALRGGAAAGVAEAEEGACVAEGAGVPPQPPSGGDVSDAATLSDADGGGDASEGEEGVGGGSSGSCDSDVDVDDEEEDYLSEDSTAESSSQSRCSGDSDGEPPVINAPCVCPAQVKVTVGGAGDVSEEGLRSLLGSYTECVTAVRLDALTQAGEACGGDGEAEAGAAAGQRTHVHVLEVTDEEAAQHLVQHFAEAEGLMLDDMPVQIEEHAPATPVGVTDSAVASSAGPAAGKGWGGKEGAGRRQQQSSQEQQQRQRRRRAEGGSGGTDDRAGQRRSEAKASGDADGGANGAPPEARRRDDRRSREAVESKAEQRSAQAQTGDAAVYHTKTGARLNISPLPRTPRDGDRGAKEWSIDVVPDPERVRAQRKAKKAKEAKKQAAKMEAAAKKRVKLYAQQWCMQSPLVAAPTGAGPVDKYKVYCYRCGSGGHRNIARCPHCSSTIYYGVAIGSEKKEKLRDEVLREWRRWLQARDDYCARNAAVAQAHAGTRQLPAAQGVVEPDFTGTIGGCFSASQGGRFFEQLLCDSHALGDDACGDAAAADAPLSCLLSTSGRAASPRTLMQGGWVGSPTAEQPFAPHPPCASAAAAASSAPPLPRVANAAALAAAAAASPPETHVSQIVDAFAFSREVLKRGADAAADAPAAAAAAAVVPRRPCGSGTWPAASGRIHRRCGTGVPVSHEAGLGSGAKVNGRKTSGGGPHQHHQHQHQHQQAAVEGVTGFAAHVTRARAKLLAGAAAAAAASAAATATMTSTTTTEGGNGGASHHRSSLSGSAYMSAVVPLPLL